jgi:hypothetical protein
VDRPAYDLTPLEFVADPAALEQPRDRGWDQVRRDVPLACRGSACRGGLGQVDGQAERDVIVGDRPALCGPIAIPAQGAPGLNTSRPIVDPLEEVFARADKPIYFARGRPFLWRCQARLLALRTRSIPSGGSADRMTAGRASGGGGAASGTGVTFA